MLPTKLRFILTSGFRREYFIVIDKQESRIANGGHVFLTAPDEMNNLNRGHSIYAFD